jgi:hypothetical protein
MKGILHKTETGTTSEYPEIEGTLALCNDKTWDDIFAEIEGSLHSEMPIRVKNWLKNKFKSPERI